jgi:hypothetical protein
VTLKARQLGCSWLAAAYALWSGMFHRGAEVLLTSQTKPDAVELLDKVKFILERLPEWLRPQVGKDNTQVLEFQGLYSTVRALPSTEKAGRGFTGKLAVADEHAFHQWATENMAAVDPAIEAGGQFLACSSANGIGNLFYDLWAKGTQRRSPVVPEYVDGVGWSFGDRLLEAIEKTPEGAWLPVFLPYGVRPGREGDWWERKQQNTVPAWLIFQEYPRDADEAFVQTGRPVFPKALLDQHKATCRDPLRRYAVAGRVRRLAPRRAPRLRAARSRAPLRRRRGRGRGLGARRLLRPLGLGRGRLPAGRGPHPPWPLGSGRVRDADRASRIGSTPGVRHRAQQPRPGDPDRRPEPGMPGLYAERAVLGKQGEVIEPGKPGWLTSTVTKPLMIDEPGQALRDFDLRLSDASHPRAGLLPDQQGRLDRAAPEGQ